METTLDPRAIEAAAKAQGLSITTLCARAGIAPSTFSRWRAGKTEPTLDVYRRLIAAVQQERAE